MRAVPPVTKASCITKLFSRFFVSFGGQGEAIVTFKGAEKIEKKSDLTFAIICHLLWHTDFECHSESANLKQFQQLLLNIHNFLNLVTRTVFFRTLFVEFQPWTITIPNRSFKFNPLCANPTKCSNTLKQFVVYLPTDCLNVFDHFVGLAPIALEIKHSYGYYFFFYRYFSFFELEKSDQ